MKNRLYDLLQLQAWLLKRFPQMDDSVWNSLTGIIQVERVKANTTILDCGQEENRIRFITSGFIQANMHLDDKSYVHSFRKTGEISCSNLSFFSNKPNMFSLRTVVPTEYLFLEKADLYSRLNSTQGMEKILLHTSNEHLSDLYQHMAQLRISTAEERFEKFARRYPDVMKYAKRKDIASVLNITPQTLSKLMKKRYCGD